jgi:hypothetical protein
MRSSINLLNAASPRAPMGGRRWSTREDEVGEKEEKE